MDKTSTIKKVWQNMKHASKENSKKFHQIKKTSRRVQIILHFYRRKFKITFCEKKKKFFSYFKELKKKLRNYFVKTITFLQNDNDTVFKNYEVGGFWIKETIFLVEKRVNKIVWTKTNSTLDYCNELDY